MSALTQYMRWLLISGFFLLWATAAQGGTLTTTAISVSPNPVQANAPLTTTVTVTGSNPTGQVCIKYDDWTTVGVGCAMLANGSATITNSWPATSAVGMHTLIASYEGDAANAPSTSSAVSYNVIGVVVKGNFTQTNAGQTVNLTASVGGNNPVGTITFKDGSSVIGSVPLSGGQAVLTQTFSTVGVHQITAEYSGDASNAAATSSPFTLNILPSLTTTAISVSPNPVQANATLTATATVTGNNPTGRVCIRYDGGPLTLGCAMLVNGTATITNSLPGTSSFGVHTATAFYEGDVANVSSLSSAVNYTVIGVMVNASSSQINPGQSTTLTATVGGNNPTGTITFKDGSSVIGTVPLTDGQAVLTQTFNTLGVHQIRADYSGDANNAAASTSNGIAVRVVKQTTTTTVSVNPNPVQVNVPLTATVTVAGNNPTGRVCIRYDGGTINVGCAMLDNGTATIINSNPVTSVAGVHTLSAFYDGDAANYSSASTVVSYAVNGVSVKGSVTQINLGHAMTFTAVVGGNNPTGTITFKDGSDVIGTVPLSGGQAVLTHTFSASGIHKVTADYSGDANNAAVTSSFAGVNVIPPSTTTSVSFSPNPVQINAPMTATVTVAGNNPTGKVCLSYDRTKPFGCAQLIDGAVTVTNAGEASSTFGTYILSATYYGDTANAMSFANVNYTVVGLSLKGDLNQANVGQAVTFTAVVGGNTPTGTITFKDGASVLGTASLTGGQAMLTQTFNTSGVHQITADYSGDANNAAATSSPFAFNVAKQPSTTSVTVSPNPVQSGQSLSVTATVAANNPPTGTVCFIYDGGAADCGHQLTGGTVVVTQTAGTVGTHTIKATFAGDANTASSEATVSYTVTEANTLPTVSLTAPSNDATFIAPASITLTASASDSDGTIAKVEFFNGDAFIGSTTSAPYSISWPNVAAGSYQVKAVATDNQDGAATSEVVNFQVAANTPSTVNLSAEASGATAPGTINISAQASDTDGGVAKVEIFNGTSLLVTLFASPYDYQWTNVPAGSYTLTARVTDGVDGTTTSDPVPVTIAAGTAEEVYAIHADHLNTPRQITDSGNNLVWEWDNSDPFGNNVPVSNAGFEFNLRFPGQYFDKETNLYYNYFRDYDPSTGRYIQSDPIGLEGGSNTYAYVEGNPVSRIDPLGLAGMVVTFFGYQVDTGMGFSLPLGHSGVVAIDNNTGATQYFDFGRYGGEYGDVRGPFDVGTMKFDSNGMPTQASMDAINKTISEKYGKGVYPSSVFNRDADARKIANFALDRQKNVAKYPYTINPFSKNNFNVCHTFANDAMGAGSK